MWYVLSLMRAGEMALAADRENKWVRINTSLAAECEQLREVFLPLYACVLKWICVSARYHLEPAL
jgi:hypothetical protein